MNINEGVCAEWLLGTSWVTHQALARPAAPAAPPPWPWDALPGPCSPQLLRAPEGPSEGRGAPGGSQLPVASSAWAASAVIASPPPPSSTPPNRAWG